MIVAMSKEFYDNNDGGNCGQSLTITWGGKSVTATMVDSCPGCAYGSLGMPPSVRLRCDDGATRLDVRYVWQNGDEENAGG